MPLFEHDYKAFPELTNSQLNEFGLLSPHIQITSDFEAEVTAVHDGDTISLKTEFRDFIFPLRLLDIDSPEMNNGGEEARDWLRSQILGKIVKIEINFLNRVGKYGRLLGKVFSDGLDVGQSELYLGFAKPFGRKLEGEVPKSDKLFSEKQWF